MRATRLRSSASACLSCGDFGGWVTFTGSEAGKVSSRPSSSDFRRSLAALVALFLAGFLAPLPVDVGLRHRVVRNGPVAVLHRKSPVIGPETGPLRTR